VAFSDSVTQRPLPGVTIDWQRTGGIDTDPVSFTRQSNVDGRASLSMRAGAPGTVTGTLTIRPPGRAETAVTGITLPTFDADSSIVARRWVIGATGTLYLLPP
jgi:hypothetical protein